MEDILLKCIQFFLNKPLNIICHFLSFKGFQNIRMAVPGIVRCYCGVGCAAIWVVISIWGFFFLGILALLFHLHKQGNIGHFKNSDETNAKVLMITWIIYIAIGILCGINLFYRIKHPFPPQEDESKKEDQMTNLTAPRETKK